MDNKPIKYLRGGVGDILLRLNNIKSGEHYKVFSHFKQAADLVKPYTNDFECIPMTTPIGYIKDEVAPTTYPSLCIPQEALKKAQEALPSNKTIVGIHPIGSDLSRAYDASTGRPQKIMTKAFLQGLRSHFDPSLYELLLFCSKEEIKLFNNLDIRIISEPYIWDCFAFVSKCNLVIAVDSAIKTVSAIMHIPTIVLLGDYVDSGRDIFINPYKEIIPIKFFNIDLKLKETIKQANLLLKL